MKFKQFLNESKLNEGKSVVSDLIFTIAYQKQLGRKDYDPQTKKLMIDIIRELQKRLQVEQGTAEALSRLQSVATSNFSKEMNRNMIFKAGASLGIKLPSGSF